MEKRGQVTIFVIVAIVLVTGALLFLYTQTDLLGQRVERVPEINPIISEIQNCLDTTSLDGIKMVGLQGGYVFLPNQTFSTNLSNIAYAYYEGRKTFNSITGIAREISSYVSLMLPECTNFSKFPDFNINTISIISSTIIQGDLVKVDTKWSLSIKKGDASYNLNSFTTTIPVRLGLIYNITNTIVNNEMKDPNTIDASYFIDVNNLYGIKIDFLPNNETIVYSITDPLSKFKNNYFNYTFLFANQFK
jgi:hypothetical protein